MLAQFSLQSFLPPAAIKALRDAGLRSFGFAILLACGAVAAALITFDAADPSFNTATPREPVNMLGSFGSHLSDLLLQWIGLGSAAGLLVIALWGARIIARSGVGELWLRGLALLSASLGLCLVLDSIEPWRTWPFPAGLGGFAGTLLTERIDITLSVMDLNPAWAWLVVVPTGILSLLALQWSAGLRLGDYPAFFRRLGGAVSGPASAVAAGVGRMTGGPMAGPVGDPDGPDGQDEDADPKRRPHLAAPQIPGMDEAPAKERRSRLGFRNRKAEEPEGDTAAPASQPEAARPVEDVTPLPDDDHAPLFDHGDDPGDEDDPLPPLPIETPVSPPSAAPNTAPTADTTASPSKPRNLVATPPETANKPPVKKPVDSRQGSLLPAVEEDGDFELPPMDLLNPGTSDERKPIDEDALNQNARLLEGVLKDFGVKGEIVKVRPGPVVTLYELEPAPGTKTARVVGLADDIARSMSAISVRIAVVPGRSVIGIELPNAKREMVRLRSLMETKDFLDHAGNLIFALGKDIGGTAVFVDLARMPHLLIAGTTGSGKSVAVNTMILSILQRLTPDQARFIMIDPKMLELSIYDGIPHLLSPVVTDPNKAVVALKWAVREMEDRYRAMSQLGVRNITGYNKKVRDTAGEGGSLTRTVQIGFDPETGKPQYEEQEIELKPLPFIIVIVDEMADLMLVAGKDVEAAIQRLAQMARAAGIHLVMATQRPSVDVITGTIKANFPTRISFQVTSKIDSRTILGEQGAEQLLGQGDMLYMAAGGRISRVHGPFVSDEEVEAICGHLRAQAVPDYVDDVTEEAEDGGPFLPGLAGGGSGGGSGGGGAGDSGDGLFDEAVAIVARERKVSTSFIQRRLQIGYNRAARLVERMEEEGMVSRPNSAGKREVLLPDHGE